MGYIVKILEKDIEEIFRPNLMKVIILLVLIIAIPIPYFDFNGGSFKLQSLGDYNIIKEILRGDFNKQEARLEDYLNPTFIEVLAISLIICYILAAFIIEIFYLWFLRDKKPAENVE